MHCIALAFWRLGGENIFRPRPQRSGPRPRIEPHPGWRGFRGRRRGRGRLGAIAMGERPREPLGSSWKGNYAARMKKTAESFRDGCVTVRQPQKMILPNNPHSFVDFVPFVAKLAKM